MDAKSLREAMKDKAKRLASATSEKVDSSTFTPAEMLDADVKTGMRPISKRAFKAGGKVDGEEMKHHAGRRARKAGGRVDVSEKIGLANTDQKTANEDRDGKKHVGGFKKGGRTGKYDGGAMGTRTAKMPQPTQEMLDSAARSEESGPEESKLAPIKSLNPPKRPYTQDKADVLTDYYKKGGKVKKWNGGGLSRGDGTGTHTMSLDEVDAEKRYKGDLTRRKSGGKAEKWEGSAKDEAQDKKLAKKRGMSMKEWEASKADEKHDEQKSMKGLKRGGHVKGCMCKACGGGASNRMARKDGGKANGDADDEQFKHPYFGDVRQYKGKKWDEGAEKWVDKKDGRTARKDGGKVKGKTNINIIISPHHDGQLGSMGQQPMPPAPPIVPPRPPVAAAAPMPMPGPVGVPPGLGQTMPAAAGVPPTPPAGMPPMMARKDGGKVYPKMRFGAGSGEGRLEKVEKYGKNA